MLPLHRFTTKIAYDMVAPTWKIEFLKMLKICHKGINIITKAMESWTVELAVEGKTLTEIKIQRCDFQ